MPPVENVHVGVAAVVRRMPERELLLVQRGSKAPYADGYGTWGLPGGWLEFGEEPFDAAEREVLEETGVNVEAWQQDGYDAGVSASGRMHIVTLFVTCGWVGGEPVNRESTASRKSSSPCGGCPRRCWWSSTCSHRWTAGGDARAEMASRRVQLRREEDPHRCAVPAPLRRLDP